MSRPQRFRRVHALGAVVFLAIPVAVACGGKVENLNGDGGASTATPTPTASATPTASTTSSASPPPTLPTPLVPCPGQPPPSPATCTVSFNDTIFPYMNNEWACTNANCHGPNGSTGTATDSPAIDGSDAVAAYLSLAQFTGVNSEPYINACSSDPNRSAILCNLEGTCLPTMPQAGDGVSPAIPPSATSIDHLKTWLACGAPFN